MPKYLTILWDRIDTGTYDTREEAEAYIAESNERQPDRENPYRIEVVADEDYRECSICRRNHITSPNPDCDFCRSCYQVGSAEERRFAELLGQLEELPNVASTPNIWNSGGGCWILEFDLADGRCVWATSAYEEGNEWHVDAGTPEEIEGPWSVCVGKNRDALHEGEDLTTHIPVYTKAFPALISNFT
jgi:hypothetical protein